MSKKIACLVKVIPDVDHFTYDYEKNILVRENQRSVLNPDDACAAAAALELKKKVDAQVTAVTMGPESSLKYMEDLLRRGADRGVLITDPAYRGSDTYVTAKILAGYLEKEGFDLIFCGTRTLDGDTSHIPSQVAELLNMNVMNHVVKVAESQQSEEEVTVKVKDETESLLFAIDFPAVIALSSDSKYKLPFVKYEDRKKDVSDRLTIITNDDLHLALEETGLEGSKTKVVRTYPKHCEYKEKKVVQNDEQGIEYVYEYLKEKGFL
ncbi:electron transfer flavoprotein subunit beta [Claveliimonas bilis]|uniref:electron transfer flavoprotein subunit beta/FixA family protein n=1 Tax=Claveliimonas bilis TaxID=3028070 RepID=UPI002930CA7B|nr:electron transfer flavoprotein subunit beta/FixA family protein [Claveliimonas bilis]BDZ84395.1 electron transfer flavoprotein subunit beta [Claveliimonas bilis]